MLDSGPTATLAFTPPPPPRRPWWEWALAALTVVALVAVAAIWAVLLTRDDGGGGEGGEAGAPTTVAEAPAPTTTPAPAVPTTAAATPTTVDDVAAAIAGYRAAYQAANDALERADPTWPALRETSTGDALANFTAFVDGFRQTGRAVRWPGGDTVDVRSLGRQGPAVVLRTCRVDDGVVYVRATGEVVNDLVGTTLSRVEMVLEGGRWKLARLTVEREWQGARPTCAD